LAGCAAWAPYTRARQPPLTVRAVEWNPLHATVEGVTGAADEGDALLLAGASVALRAGAVIARHPGLVRVAALPAADSNMGGTWLVGVDGNGRLWRLHGAVFEDVSSRYGLGDVRDVCAAGASIVFRLDHELAVADGRRVTRHLISLDDLACGPGRAVGRSQGKIVALDLARRSLRSFPLDAIAAAVDGRGRVVAATRRALYVEDQRGLALRYLAGDELRDLTGGGGRVWFSDGARLGALDDDRLAISEPLLLPSARLQGSASGDVWALGGAPLRFGRDGDRWASLVQPVFARACADCHLPGGAAGVDLSSSAAWSARRKLVEERVLVKRSMPPDGHPLAERDRQAIRDWLNQ
jgi:hypothetical protein